jgi:hypothetical protein
VTLWLELLIRDAAVYIIVLMLPLFFAAMVWPARRIWAVRAVELLVALILSKFAIVAVLSLGGAALGHALVPGIQSLFAGTALVLLAAFSPWAILRLLPLHELAGAAVGGLRPAMAQRPSAAEERAHPAADRSEDLAAQLPARLSWMQRGSETNGAAADAMQAPTARAVAPDPEPEVEATAQAADGRAAPAASAQGVPAAGAQAVPAAGAQAVPAAGGQADDDSPPPVPDEPRRDAFGIRVRPGRLPSVLRPQVPWRHLDLGPGGLGPDQPPLDLPDPDAAREPDPDPDGGGPALLPPPAENDPE